jgi:hypothetical protein
MLSKLEYSQTVINSLNSKFEKSIKLLEKEINSVLEFEIQKGVIHPNLILDISSIFSIESCEVVIDKLIQLGWNAELIIDNRLGNSIKIY